MSMMGEPEADGDISDMSGATKAAVLMMRLGKDKSALVLRYLRESEVSSITAEIAKLRDITAEKVAAVLNEFRIMAAAQAHLASGGVEFARELLIDALGPEKAATILERLNVTLEDLPFESIRRADPRQVLGFLQEEHPQTIALVIAHLPPESAAMILSGLEEELQRDVAVRLAKMDQTSPEVVSAVEESLMKRLSNVLRQSEFSSAGGVGALVEILNRSDRATERLIFEGLEDFDTELADEVRSRMFVFEDIVTLDDRSVQLVLRQVDSKSLGVALKGVKQEVRQKIFQNISSRAAQSLAEEIEMLGAVRLKTVEEAQGAIVRVIRSLEESGQIVVARAGADEFVT